MSFMLAARILLEAVEALVEVLWRCLGDSGVAGVAEVALGSRIPSGCGKETGVGVLALGSEEAMIARRLVAATVMYVSPRLVGVRGSRCQPSRSIAGSIGSGAFTWRRLCAGEIDKNSSPSCECHG